MSEVLPFIFVGLVAGSVYGLTAVGLVVTFKTSGIFNFAQGAVATVSAYAFYELWQNVGLSWGVSFLLSVLVLGVLMALALERIARVLARMSTAMKIVGTLGALLVVQGAANIFFGTGTYTVPPYFPNGTFEVGGAFIGYGQVIVIAIAVVATACLYVFFRVFRTGTAMRAVVDNPTLVASQGTNPVAVRRWAWIIGTVFASLSGVLLVPFVALSSLVLTLLIVQAFGAAAIGFFSNMPLTFVGGLLIGVASAIATNYVPASTILIGLPSAIPFIVLFLVLILVPRRKLATHAVTLPRPRIRWSAPARLQVIGGLVLVTVLIVIPWIVGARLPFFINALAAVILFLSLGILIRSSGQISLAHMGFAAIGAAAFAHFGTNLGLPWLVALILAGLVAVPVGAFIAIPAIRLSPLFLALATLGFGIVLENMFYTAPFMFGASSNGLRAPRPDLSWLGLNEDVSYYYVALLVVVVCCALAVWLDRARFGRLLRGLADAPTALSTLGTTSNVTKVLVFCVSAFLAAISGGVTASSAHYISGGSFPSFSSLTLVVLLALIPGRIPWYAFGGAFALYVIPSFFTGINITNWLTVLFGIGALQAALTLEEKGRVPVKVLAWLDRVGGRKPEVAQALAETPAVASASGQGEPAAAGFASRTPSHAELLAQRAPSSTSQTTPRHGLEVTNLRVTFGGVTAVEDLSLTAPPGVVTGLIGPNGAGKTTIFNACSGLVRPTVGTVTKQGRDVSHLSAPRRARLGLGRTFQQMELFNSLSVRENVALGVEATLAGAAPMRQFRATRAEQIRMDEQSATAIEMCGIGHLVDQQVGLLSTGQRRLVELARCLAGPYDMLLLDEPSSGLTPEEKYRFGEVLHEVIVTDPNIGILIVEHDMSLVMSLCDHVYVLDFGRLIFQGSAAEVSTSSMVREAYLGSTELETETEEHAAKGAVD